MMSNIPLNIDYQQIFLHLLNFVILFAVMYFLLYKPVKNFMDKRKEFYEDRENETAKNLKEAEDKKKAYTEKLEKAEEEINEYRVNAHKKVAEDNERSIRRAKEEADKIVKDARENAENERDRILESCNADIQSMVTDAAEKLVLKSTAGDAYDQFLSAVERGNDDE